MNILFLFFGCFVWIDKSGTTDEQDGYTQFEENSGDTGSMTTNSDTDSGDSGEFEEPDSSEEPIDTQENTEPEDVPEPEDIDIDTDFPTCEEFEYSGSTYLFCPRTFGMPGWLEAKMYCEEWEGHLVTLNDYSEFEWLTILGHQVDGSANWWIGLHDRNTEGEWEWENGEPFDYLYNWHPSSPEDADDIDCAFMGRDGDGWRRSGCMSSQTFICEK